MAYSTNPNLPKARAIALKLLILDNHRTTLWRWKRKWEERNKLVQRHNYNRPSRGKVKSVREYRYSWSIPTLPSTPKSHPQAIPDRVVQRVLILRYKLKRCAEAVWHYAARKEKLAISLSGGDAECVTTTALTGRVSPD